MKTLAIVFPGQGSQSVGMMNAYADLPAIADTLAEASSILGEDVAKLIAEGPAEALAKTVNTQPVMLIAGVACWRGWKALGGPDPSFFAGHSLGEYTALVAAEAMTFADALPLVRVRAEAMQAAVPEGTGGIAAILGLDLEPLSAACKEASAGGEVAEIANLNAPGQIVIAGHRAAVERALASAKTKGAKRGVMLPMSAPSHCSLMRPAAEKLSAALAKIEIRTPRIPVVQNATVAATSNPDDIRKVLTQQVASPVRWIETINLFSTNGVATVVELGPGKVLTGLNGRITPSLQCMSAHDASSMQAALAAARA